jgi:copper homeostasis protein
MLRPHSGFTLPPAALDPLLTTARHFRAAGFEEFVFGFLTPQRTLDLPRLHTLAAALQPARWTLHRAFDHTPDPAASLAACATLPGLDHILTSGAPADLDAGLDALCQRAALQTPTLRWIAGGGLRLEHIPPLRAAGITAFHAGRAVRLHQSWDTPVDPAQVALLKEALHPAR